MGKQVQKIRVFVATPSDVQEERKILRKVIEELNRMFGENYNTILDFIRWETHAVPDMGRAQAIINQQIGPYDIFVGIMWKRFGTPTGDSESGTQEEFNLAYESWKQSGKPRIMFYFNQLPYTLRSVEETEQVRNVIEFRSQLEKHGLIWEYDNVKNFESVIREHLNRVVHDIVHNTDRNNLSVENEKTTVVQQEPVQELFFNAISEWKKHRVFASRDRLDLFLLNKHKFKHSKEELLFITESWFKCGEYSPEDFLKSYDEKTSITLCKNIISKERDVDIVNGAIKTLGNQETVACANILLDIIEKKDEFQESSRLTAIERFWMSKIKGLSYKKIERVLIHILQNESSFKLRKEAAYTLSNYPSEKVVAALEKALEDSRSQVRASAITALSDIRKPSSIDPLITLLTKESWSIKMRKRIVAALGYFSESERVRKVLSEIVESSEEDSQVVKEAKWGLSEHY